jgi:hypothetical protein
MPAHPRTRGDLRRNPIGNSAAARRARHSSGVSRGVSQRPDTGRATLGLPLEDQKP